MVILLNNRFVILLSSVIFKPVLIWLHLNIIIQIPCRATIIILILIRPNCKRSKTCRFSFLHAQWYQMTAPSCVRALPLESQMCEGGVQRGRRQVIGSLDNQYGLMTPPERLCLIHRALGNTSRSPSLLNTESAVATWALLGGFTLKNNQHFFTNTEMSFCERFKSVIMWNKGLL